MRIANFKKLILTCGFGVTMGYLEAVVVIYIRKILAVANAIDMAKVFLKGPNLNMLRIEQSREVATILMLTFISAVAVKKWYKKFGIFLWIFGIWDIFYYTSLKALIDWPPSLKTMDCLFLIPCPWIIPVYVPVICSIFMCIIGFFLVVRNEKTPF